MGKADQRKAVVFGHTSGLGLALSHELIRRGYTVVGVARTATMAESANMVEISADLSDETALSRAIDLIRSEHSANLEVLIYCAGVLTAHDLDDLNYAEMTHLYRVNLFAPMMIASRLLDVIEQNGVDVINVTSSSILDYYPTFAEYSTAKAAFAKFTDDLRRRLQASAARVVELCPSGFTGNMYSNMTGDKIDRDESKQIEATDLAKLIGHVLDLPKRIEVGRLYVNRKN